MSLPLNKYHLDALEYLHNYYREFADESFYFGYSFIKGLAEEGDKIARSQNLQGMDYTNAMIIICFRFAGVTNFIAEEDTKYKLLNDFAMQVNYPGGELQNVETSIRKNVENSGPTNHVEIVAWDAIASRFVLDDLVAQVSFLKEEMNRLNTRQYSETEILLDFKEKFTHSSFITDFGKEHYTEKKEKNLIRLIKRIQKLQPLEVKSQKDNKLSLNLTDKETDDLFKLAFRNYVSLVSVADKKAGLLINVNSIIISVVIAFVIGRSDRYPFLLTPSFFLLGVAFITILLSILASRPQRNRLLQDRKSKSYQTFFFGSFDLIGSDFFKADWNSYSNELDAFLKGGKDRVYQEMYKETFNVRKVLGKKFSYLSVAYWMFLTGLFVSIVAFFLSTNNT
jgi:Family of unknown function (DUF5706)